MKGASENDTRRIIIEFKSYVYHTVAMSLLNDSRQALARFFVRRRIAPLGELFRVLKTRSRMTVFRKLTAVGYLASYSHARRFYTLKDIPKFDVSGLWQHRGVCFSRHETLKETVAELIEHAESGRFHRELEEALQVRVHNTLLDLVRRRRIGRTSVGGEYLYLSRHKAKAATQAAKRQETLPDTAGRGAATTQEAGPWVVIEVLSEVIRMVRSRASPARIVARLASRGVAVTAETVAWIFRKYGVQKKGLRSRWKPSRR